MSAKEIFLVALLFVTNCSFAQVGLSPSIISLGSSSRYSASSVAGGLNVNIVANSFRDVVRSKFTSDSVLGGLDESMYFRLGSGGVGTKSMLRLRSMSKAHVIGLYAEARLGHSEGWRPIAKRNASQHDVFRYENGRRIFAQVKTHRNGNPRTYSSDMRKDNQSSRFLIPDDHYETTLNFLREQAQQAKLRGEYKNVTFYERQVERLGKIGASYGQLENEAQLAVKLANARIIAARVGWILSGVMSIHSAYTNFDAYQTGIITGNELVLNLGKDVLLAGAGMSGAAIGNSLFRASPWAAGGTAAICVFLVQESFLILKYGSFEAAFSNPQFWVNTGSNIGGASLGLAGAIYVGKVGAYVGSAFGPVGTGLGATLGGVVGGGAGAAIGSYGGAEAARIVTDLCDPDWVYQRLNAKIDRRKIELQEMLN
jgi:hypothetical protein